MMSIHRKFKLALFRSPYLTIRRYLCAENLARINASDDAVFHPAWSSTSSTNSEQKELKWDKLSAEQIESYDSKG